MRRIRIHPPTPAVCTAVLGVLLFPGFAQSQEDDWSADPPALDELVAFAQEESDLRVAVARYTEDRSALFRRYDIPFSPVRRERFEAFYHGWLEALEVLDFDGLDGEGQVDYVLLKNQIEFELTMLAEEARNFAEISKLVPFARSLQRLQEDRRDRLDVDARAAAETLDRVADEIVALQGRLASAEAPTVKGVAAERAAGLIDQLSTMLSRWHGFYDGYDPEFTWWTGTPYERVSATLGEYADAVRDRYLGDAEDGPVIGDPIGDEGLAAHLKREMIPYTADELIRIAEAEFAWMEEELVAASREMGYGDDWRAAQEAVKELAVEPGQKPAVVRELESQSVTFVEDRDWLTIPPLAREVWRMEMMSAERQLVSPFFLGGEVIRISYPTDEMSHDDKLMSMRGNNPHFNRATVHHELIPGHHLQGFMTDRFNEHRSTFNTPFWGEGWALYWEMRLWENDFPRGPEDRIGMLFWRMHRAARIIFSLSFHLERMTPQEAVDFLVDRVGFERANAEAEVRRSFAGSYPPMYQAAYMLGGMQFRALHRELVESGQMTEEAFHDQVLTGGRMPVEMVRARLLGVDLDPDYTSRWRFAEPPRS